MIAVVMFGLVSALVVLWWRARDEIRRAKVEVAVAEERAIRAEKRAIAAEVRAQLVELRAKAVLQRTPQDVDGDQDKSRKPPIPRPTVAQ
jgi:hypothetical protein